MIRAVVTGSKGQVASALAAKAATDPDLDLRFLSRPQFDLEAPEAMAEEIKRMTPDVVLSVGAYTSVDAAEDEPENAMAINGKAPGVLAHATADLNIPIVHLSTDYVFAGTGDEPFVETDQPDPMTQYGRSKLAGEQAIARANPRHIILRTAWVYSTVGNNFVKTMLRLAKERTTLSVVHDQTGNPTSAVDLAEALIVVARSALSPSVSGDHFGTFHAVGREATNWASFAEEIFRLSAQAGGPSAIVEPIPSSAFPTRARRPMNSKLNGDKLERVYRHVLPGYTEALPSVVEALLATE